MTDAIMVQRLLCARLAPFTALRVWPTGYWKSTIHSHACLGSISSMSRCFIPFQPCCKADCWDAKDEQDGQKRRDRQMGRFRRSSAPPNGHPPRSRFIFMQGELCPSFFFFPVSAKGSGCLLEWMLPASKVSQGGNKSSSG